MIKYKWTGRPNVAPSAVVKLQSATFGLDVVGEWEASHFNWKDSLTIDALGRFARGNGDQGSWFRVFFCTYIHIDHIFTYIHMYRI
jgi:hypothetical protein